MIARVDAVILSLTHSYYLSLSLSLYIYIYIYIRSRLATSAHGQSTVWSRTSPGH
jgi:hypothetical protein